MNPHTSRHLIRIGRCFPWMKERNILTRHQNSRYERRNVPNQRPLRTISLQIPPSSNHLRCSHSTVSVEIQRTPGTASITNWKETPSSTCRADWKREQIEQLGAAFTESFRRNEGRGGTR